MTSFHPPDLSYSAKLLFSPNPVTLGMPIRRDTANSQSQADGRALIAKVKRAVTDKVAGASKNKKDQKQEAKPVEESYSRYTGLTWEKLEGYLREIADFKECDFKVEPVSSDAKIDFWASKD